MKTWIHAACLAGILAMSSGQVNAATFELGDHPDGQLIDNGAYGLRLDRTLFSVGSNIDVGDPAKGVVLDFDPVAMTASMTGVIQMAYKNGAGFDSPDLWDLTYTFTGVVALGGGVGGFTATGGSGQMTDRTPGDIDGFYDEIFLTGKQDSTGIAFYFQPNGYRLDGDSASWVGRGWQYAHYYRKYGKKIYIGGTKDFLVTAMRRVISLMSQNRAQCC